MKEVNSQGYHIFWVLLGLFRIFLYIPSIAMDVRDIRGRAQWVLCVVVIQVTASIPPISERGRVRSVEGINWSKILFSLVLLIEVIRFS